jgi:endogenous inhibitor of DNA gyrase (YacG/DUF329 family)
MASVRQVKCPSCGAPAAFDASNRFRPFCSERCRITDLGDWAAERHRIAADAAEGLPEAGADGASDGPCEPERG